MARPAALVPAVTGEAIPASVAGPEKMILILATGFPALSITFATSGEPKTVLIAAFCRLPENTVTALGGAGSIVTVKDPVAVCLGTVESLTLKLIVLVPREGAVPEITPVELFTVRPAGRPVAVQV